VQVYIDQVQHLINILNHKVLIVHVEIHVELVHLLFVKIKVCHDQVLIDNIQEMNLLLFEMHYVKRLNILPKNRFSFVFFFINKIKFSKTRCKHRKFSLTRL